MAIEEKSVFGFFLPDGIFKWFDIAGGSKDENNVRIILEEKNIPPLT